MAERFPAKVKFYIPQGGDTDFNPDVPQIVAQHDQYQDARERGGTILLRDNQAKYGNTVPTDLTAGDVDGVPDHIDYDHWADSYIEYAAILTYRRNGDITNRQSNPREEILLDQHDIERATENREPREALQQIQDLFQPPDLSYEPGPVEFETDWEYTPREPE